MIGQVDGQDELDPETYVRATALAIVAAALRPSPTYEVPEGFPEEFPVVEGAHLVESTVDGESVSARWQVDAEAAGGFESVDDFYSAGLQQGVPGRWSVSRSSGGVTQGAGTVVVGDRTLEVSGYGMTGTVAFTMPEGAPAITVDATLTPEG